MRMPKAGESIWECPQCKKLYYVSSGIQMHCQKFRFGRNGHMYEEGGCNFFGGFKRVGGCMTNERRQWKLRMARSNGIKKRIWD
jgi:hypothetical protein